MAQTFIMTLLTALLWTEASASNILMRTCINKDCSAVRISINNPPINLFNAAQITSFNTFLHGLENQTQTKVVVFSSALPDFFSAHLDLNLLEANTTTSSPTTTLYQENIDLLLSLPVIFIGEINGRTWGAGDENAVRYDMRFAGPDAIFGAPEAAGGLLHFGGAQQLVRLIGPGLALEYLVSSAEVSATEAARVGWVNRAFANETDLRKYVDLLATRVALFESEVLMAHKKSVAESAPSKKALDDDAARFKQLLALPTTGRNIERILKGTQNESRNAEIDINDNIVRILYQ